MHDIFKGPFTKFEVELMSYNYPYFCYDYTTSNSNILVEKILLKWPCTRFEVELMSCNYPKVLTQKGQKLASKNALILPKIIVKFWVWVLYTTGLVI